MLYIKHIDLTRLGTDSGAADFGRVLGGVWEAKILDFRVFFDVFSMSFSKSVSEEQKNRPKRPNKRRWLIFWAWFPVIPPLLGREKERGSRAADKELGLAI